LFGCRGDAVDAGPSQDKSRFFSAKIFSAAVMAILLHGLCFRSSASYEMRQRYAIERRKKGKAFEAGGIGRRKAKPGRILRPVRPISNRESLRIS